MINRFLTTEGQSSALSTGLKPGLSRDMGTAAADHFADKSQSRAAQSVLRVLVEALLFASVFIVTAVISLSVPVQQMVGPMIAVVCMIICCMIVSGVYQQDAAKSVASVFKRSVYGFCLSAAGLFVLLNVLPDVYSTGRFVFFFLFILFFVTNTVRPLLYGTDFNDGGGRRSN